jgi:mRNA-degrading endonuclease RelE of RelBE toxin-antitoxin system
MAEVEITPTALDELSFVPRLIQQRIRKVFVRLTRWPAVSGAKPLRGELTGNYRIRTGDYRVVFNVHDRKSEGAVVTVWKNWLPRQDL